MSNKEEKKKGSGCQSQSFAIVTRGQTGAGRGRVAQSEEGRFILKGIALQLLSSFSLFVFLFLRKSVATFPPPSLSLSLRKHTTSFQQLLCLEYYHHFYTSESFRLYQAVLSQVIYPFPFLGLFLRLFLSFQTNSITILTTNKCEKCPSNIQCWDQNSQSSELKSPPITNRPSGQSYKGSMIINYNSRVVPDWKKPILRPFLLLSTCLIIPGVYVYTQLSLFETSNKLTWAYSLFIYLPILNRSLFDRVSIREEDYKQVSINVCLSLYLFIHPTRYLSL